MPVYAILIQSDEGVELLPNYFSTYLMARAEVKIKYPDWDDRFEGGRGIIYGSNKVDVSEGHKMPGSDSVDPNLTELYIEKGINISIRRLVKKPTRLDHPPSAAGGGYSRRRQNKRNTKNSRKHRI